MLFYQNYENFGIRFLSPHVPEQAEDENFIFENAVHYNLHEYEYNVWELSIFVSTYSFSLMFFRFVCELLYLLYNSN